VRASCGASSRLRGPCPARCSGPWPAGDETTSTGCRAWPISRYGPQLARQPSGAASLLAPTQQTAGARSRGMIEADPVAGRVQGLMARAKRVDGKCPDPLRVTGCRALERTAGWPKTPRPLAGRRRRVQTFLRMLGIEVRFSREHAYRTYRQHRQQRPRPRTTIGGQNNLNRPTTFETTNIDPIWSVRARLGRPSLQPQTMLTVLTQTPLFVSANGGTPAAEIWSGRPR